MVIRFDAGRQRLWARPDEVATLLLRFGEPDAPALAEEASRTALAGFTEAGAMVDGAPVREVAELLSILLRHQLLVEVETTIGDAPGPSHTLWLGRELGVLAEGMVGENRWAYAPVAPTLLPWVLGHLVALRRRPAPTLGHAVTVARRLLDAAMADIDADASARAVASLTQDGGLSRHAATAMAAMLASRRLTWRATSLWQDGGPQSRSLTVVDAVDAGYWVSSPPDDADFDDPELGVTLEPVASGEVWRRLTFLLPGVTGTPQ